MPRCARVDSQNKYNSAFAKCNSKRKTAEEMEAEKRNNIVKGKTKVKGGTKAPDGFPKLAAAGLNGQNGAGRRNDSYRTEVNPNEHMRNELLVAVHRMPTKNKT